MMWLKGVGVGLAVAILILVGLCLLQLQDRPAELALGERVVIQGPGGELVYYRSGEGETVILLPSFARSASDFNALTDALHRAGYRTLALQPRGIEGSELGEWRVGLQDYAADVAAMLDAEEIVRVGAVIGHAYGNRVARVFASRYPERVGVLVLLAAGGEGPPAAKVSAAVRTAVFGFDGAARTDAIQYSFFASGNVPPASWVTGWYPLAALQQARATTAQTYDSWSDGGRAPMLVLQPAEDRAAPADQSAVFAERYAGRVTRHVIAGSGHALLPEQPAEVAALILGYLNQTQHGAL